MEPYDPGVACRLRGDDDVKGDNCGDETPQTLTIGRGGATLTAVRGCCVVKAGSRTDTGVDAVVVTETFRRVGDSGAGAAVLRVVVSVVRRLGVGTAAFSAACCTDAATWYLAAALLCRGGVRFVRGTLYVDNTLDCVNDAFLVDTITETGL